MARNLAQLVDTVEQALLGAADPRTGAVGAINEAGHYLCAAAEWTFLRRPEQVLGTTAGQAWIALPSDLSEIIALNTYEATITGVHLVSNDQIQRMRASQLQSSLEFYAALEYPTQTASTALPIGPRLAVWPTPGNTTANVFRMLYRAGWVELSDMSAYPNIPADMETLLIETARAIAQGRKAGGSTSVERLDAITKSITFSRMVARYGRSQSSLGAMVGGAAQYPTSYTYRPYTSIPDPA